MTKEQRIKRIEQAYLRYRGVAKIRKTGRVLGFSAAFTKRGGKK